MDGFSQGFAKLAHDSLQIEYFLNPQLIGSTPEGDAIHILIPWVGDATAVQIPLSIQIADFDVIQQEAGLGILLSPG
jgi:hypothetical protein